ncbi:hypothetical protein D3C71_1189710 [compost metagenome]
MSRVVQIQIVLARVNIFILDNDTFTKFDPMLQCFKTLSVGSGQFVKGVEGKAQTNAHLKL